MGYHLRITFLWPICLLLLDYGFRNLALGNLTVVILICYLNITISLWFFLNIYPSEHYMESYFLKFSSISAQRIKRKAQEVSLHMLGTWYTSRHTDFEVHAGGLGITVTLWTKMGVFLFLLIYLCPNSNKIPSNLKIQLCTSCQVDIKMYLLWIFKKFLAVWLECMFLNTINIVKSFGEIFKILMLRLHPRSITSNSHGMRSRHLTFLKLPRWFQSAFKGEAPWNGFSTPQWRSPNVKNKNKTKHQQKC